jgi:hypothetical protein
VQLPAAYAHRSKIVKATIRGLEVAEKSIDAYESPANDAADDKPAEAGQVVTFELPPEVAGPVTIELYDSETSELLEKQLVLREPTRKLNVSVVDGQASYPPGETVALTLQFSDENGQPAAGAWFGVRVWSEQAVRSFGPRPLLLADALRHVDTDEMQDGEQSYERAKTFGLAASSLAVDKRSRMAREGKSAEEEATVAALDEKKLDEKKADESLVPRAEVPQPAAPLTEADAPPQVAALPDAGAAAAGVSGFGNLEAGGEGLHPRNYDFADSAGSEYRLEPRLGYASEDTILASNSAVVRAQYEAALHKAADEQRGARATIGWILVLGGSGALVLLGLMALWKLPAKARVVAPSLAVGVASVLLGLGWMGAHPGASWQKVAMVADGDVDRAKATPAPTTTPAPAGEALDLAVDRSAALGSSGSGGGGMRGNDLAFPPGGSESRNAPVDEHRRSLSVTESMPSKGAAAFGSPAGGAKGQGGANGQGGQAERELFSRFHEQTENPLSLKQGSASGESAPRKSAGDATRGDEKYLQEGIDGRGAAPAGLSGLAKTSPDARRNVAPGGAPLPAEPLPAEPLPAAALPAVPPPAPAEATPAPAAAPATSPAPSRPQSAAARPQENEKDATSESGGKAKKEAARDKSGDQLRESSAAEGDENREKADPSATKPSRPSVELLGAVEDRFGRGNGAPAAIYFNPRLIANENGRATIEFTLPRVESEYRLLIDALGNGRIGSLQQRIEVKAAK